MESKSFLIYTICLFIYSVTIGQEQTIIISSKHLSKKVKITTYNTYKKNKIKHLIYVTDGQKLINHGGLQKIKSLTKNEKIPYAYYVFISTINPETNQDLRNFYFFNNSKYLDFFESELIPKIETSLTNSRFQPEDRSLIGISFGGLNAAYFSSKSEKFKNFGLLSPVTYPKKEELIQNIIFSKNKNLKIFLSTGTNDAESYVKDLKAIYTSKGYKIKTLKTAGNHDFKNWNKQLETIIKYLLIK
ncbi:Enterochelin esterase [Aquimarina amphilecti]|uniref:Enterochelin esterase n=1 Tax=Aquimarina amphilecti TaxID=1038014 RepID=A0A1H7J6U2_AQUAM|nr:alpha/beta hydrolase-fold protein [Aquimarina amphilecti]SEK70503.1 Enterochelin esterase [Aquimarina amphilecti]